MNKRNIYVTKSYNQFSIIDTNRRVKPLKVAKLKEAMKKKYLGAQYPILVRAGADKTKWIIDGQHRFAAAKELKYSVYYIVTDLINNFEIGDINSLQDKWTLYDAMRSHRKAGNHDYKVIDAFVKNHKIPITTALIMLSSSEVSSASQSHKFRDGKFKVTGSLQSAENLMQKVNDILPYFSYAKSRSFISAVKTMSQVKKYDHKRMISSIKCQRDKIYRCSDRISYIRMLEGIYNFNRQESNRVRFD